MAEGAERRPADLSQHNCRHRGRSISHHHIGSLGQGMLYSAGIVGVEKPKRFLPGQLDQSRLVEKRFNPAFAAADGPASGSAVTSQNVGRQFTSRAMPFLALGPGARQTTKPKTKLVPPTEGCQSTTIALEAMPPALEPDPRNRPLDPRQNPENTAPHPARDAPARCGWDARHPAGEAWCQHHALQTNRKRPRR